jgi:ribosomal protein L21E
MVQRGMASAEPTSVEYDERSQRLVRERRNRRREVPWIRKLQMGDLGKSVTVSTRPSVSRVMGVAYSLKT